MKFKALKYFSLIALAASLFTSCIKDTVDEVGDRGSNFVKILEAPENKIFFEPFTGTKEVKVFDIRKDVANEGELNKPLTLKLKLDTAAIRAYNTAHNNDTWELLPDSLYTILTPGVTKNGLEYTVSLQAGEFSKPINISLNGSKWDVTHKYVFPFTIIDAGGLKISDEKGDIMPMISVKNKWDGTYSVESGEVIRYTAPGVPAGDALSGDISANPDVVLATVGPTTVEISNLRWANGGGMAGIDNLRATIDPATNQVTMFALGNPTLTNWADHDNYYDPATKTLHIAFIWNPTANVRTYEAVIKYKGPR